MPVSTQKTPEKTRRPLMSLDSQLALAVLGAGVFLWLAFRFNPEQLHPARAFAKRLAQIAPELAALAVGIACLFWGAVLIGKSKAKKPKVETTAAIAPRAATQKGSPASGLFLAGYYALAFLWIGERFARFLWPVYDRRISGIAGLAALFLLVADVGLRWQRRKAAQRNAQPESGVREESWFANDFMRTVFYWVLAVGVIFVSFRIIHRFGRTHERILFTAAAIAIAAGFEYMRQSSRPSAAGSHRDACCPPRPGAARKPGSATNTKKIAAFYGAALVVLLGLPLPAQWKTGIIFAQVPLLAIYIKALSTLKMRIFRLGKDGRADEALQLDRRWRWLPGYGPWLEGSILFNAGRYREAQEFIRPSAFDAQGKPRLGTSEIYTYALALGNSGRLADAQPLLEASIPVSEQPDSFRVALATNLLDQNKEPERARQLLEEAMATPAVQSTLYGQQADESMRMARYAWALARCGRTEEAAAEIQDAFERGAGLKDSDLAGIHYFAGEAWSAAGEAAKARAAFQEAIRLNPDGLTAIEAKKGMGKLATV